jgi:hypothetical protein
LYGTILEIYLNEGSTMKRSLLIATALLLCTGCSATWKGMKEDTSSATSWTKGEVNKGATSVKEKTQ